MRTLIRRFLVCSYFLPAALTAQAKPDPRITRLKADLATAIDAKP